MLIGFRWWRWPTSKSLKSCAGVIFTAPEPSSGSAYSSPTIGMRRPTSGRIDVLADEVLVARRSSGCTATATSPSMVSGRVVATTMVSVDVLDRVAEVPHLAGDLDVLDLEVGDRGLEPRVPVHQPLGAVDQALLVELDEHLADGVAEPLVHGEALARPVGRGAEALELIDDGAAALGLPLPDALEELLAAHLAARRLLPLHQLALDDHLRRDAGMVGARLPQHVLAAHALEADQDVLDGVVERVPDM